jgi:glycosyltransferase involved in cell wall biosynthesis
VRDWEANIHLDCDILVMQRVMIDDVADKLPAAIASGQIILNDVDDWYWGLSTNNSAFVGTHPKTNRAENTSHYRSVLARSSGLIVSTPYLADRLSQFVRCPIEVIGNYVDLDRFTPRTPINTTMPIVGWVGSTAHRSGDVEILRGVLGPMQVNGEIALHHSGWHPGGQNYADMIGVDPNDVTAIPLVPPEQYPSVFQFDVGIAPLANVPFNRAKSWIKATEYAAAGIPFVASNLDAYVALRNEYGIGRLAKNPAQWRKHLSELRDPGVRAEEAVMNLARLEPLDLSHGAKAFGDYLATWP